ncbi:MAG TPA: diguanylate cyclase [Anaerovoracaceae bacterium]|nr:diguanylate cyclase [Anaerovoracaceae bacterium]
MLQNNKKSVRLITGRYKYHRECLFISLIYLSLGVLWILFSDKLAYVISPDKTVFSLMNTYKGLGYVIITSLILYLLLKRLLKKAEQAEKENLYLSYYDVLTGLYNRRYYEMEIKRMDVEKNLPISVIMADVNGLKLINDAFGHQMGDQLLQKSADIIKNNCRPKDVLARWGGDEFVILLPNTSCEEARQLLEHIRGLCVLESIDVVQVSMSLGCAAKESMDVSFEEVLKNAEDDMYKHKVILNEGLRGNIINMIIKTLYEKNPREEEHSERVGELAGKIGMAIGLSEKEVGKLRLIGHLHDIGKIAISEGILNKEGKLTEREREEIRRHPDVGYRILSATGEMTELADCVLAHHERWDGGGYPRGLSGEHIPVEARIIALADSYDAMSRERPYRKALNEDVILFEIRRNAGYQFDPGIARVFVEDILGKPWKEEKFSCSLSNPVI